jgi:glutamate 5-kinase
MAIANGNYDSPIKKIFENKKCTWFLPKISKLDARKQWIIGSISPKGEVIIDHGAVKAIKNGK